MKRVAAPLAVLGLLFFYGEPAEACSPACGVPKLAPAAGASVPASAPGFLFIGSSGETAAAQVVDSNGAVVPGSYQKDSASDRMYFAPSSPLAPGSYATRAPKSCNGSETIDTPFTVTAGTTLPAATGALSLKKNARGNLSASTSSGSCVEPVDAAYIDFEVDIDAALAPYLSLVTWQTTVDGIWWSQQDPVDGLSAPDGDARSYLRLFTPCDGKKPIGRDQGLLPGKHAVEVRAFLPGGAALAPAKVTIDLSCDGSDIVGDGEISGGGAQGGTGSGAGSGSGSGSGFGTTSPTSSSGRRSQDGCSSTPQLASSSTSISAAIVALLALAGLRRRRNTLD